MNVTQEMLDSVQESVDWYEELMQDFNGDDLSPKYLVQDGYEAWTKLKTCMKKLTILGHVVEKTK